MNIGIFCPNWIGDLVMATPALRAVRDHFPDAHITAVLRPYVADVLAGLDLVDDLLFHDPRARHSSQRGLGFLKQLRSRRFDSVLLLPNSFRSAWWAYLSGAKQRVGYNRYGRGLLLTDAVPAKSAHQPHPALDDYLELTRHLGCTPHSRQMELATLLADRQQLQEFWSKQVDVNPCEPGVICLNPGGAFGAAKHWPVSSFAALARRLAIELGRRVLVLCGPSEREQARDIAKQARHPAVYHLADERPSLGLTKAAVQQAELLVTTDSGPRHFAPPFGVPVVTLFGPTHIAWSETHYDRGQHLQLQLDCGPCQQRTCPLQHHRCMRDLSVDTVFAAVVHQLARSAALPRAA